ncbi:hypothetical protein CPB83DRAFT_897995 [Crepidotus variabilis]|uniref:Uncharacterized protein n=1 Tax=Crepidotus variabilis TaxID=179855 RepID=A0A9P6E8B0_9AGAR|nr:hypothetical protein CPB83DRAFT_897995 [Crepidotus variabilis]
MGEYLYYQIFNGNSLLNVRTPFDTAKATIGRIQTIQISHPLNAGKVKREIASREGFPVDDPTTALYFVAGDDTPAEDSQMIAFAGDAQFGSDSTHPIAVIFQGNPTPSTDKSSTTDLSGGWSIEENISGRPMFRGILVLVMRSATTFDGFVQQSNVSAGGAYSSFPVSNGSIVDGKVEWTLGGAGWGGNANNLISRLPHRFVCAMGDNNIYYQIFNDDGVINVKAPFDSNDATLGRIPLNQIPPPRNVANLKRVIAKREGLQVTSTTSLFFSLNDATAAEDDQMIAFSSEGRFGGDLQDPIGINFQGTTNSTKQNSNTDLAGGWSIDERNAGTPMFRGTLNITMTSATTFEGFGSQTNVSVNGAASFPFRVINGRIVEGAQVEWTTIGYNNSAADSWRVGATLDPGGKSMSGSVNRLSGNTIDVPDCTYRRL